MLITASCAVSRQMLHSNAELSCAELLFRLVGCDPAVSSCRPLSDEDVNDEELIIVEANIRFGYRKIPPASSRCLTSVVLLHLRHTTPTFIYYFISLQEDTGSFA